MIMNAINHSHKKNARILIPVHSGRLGHCTKTKTSEEQSPIPTKKTKGKRISSDPRPSNKKKKEPYTIIRCPIHHTHAQPEKNEPYTMIKRQTPCIHAQNKKKKEIPTQYKMPNTTKNETPLQITAHGNKNRNPLEIQRRNTHNPNYSGNPELICLKDENPLRLRTGKVNHIHTITILAVITMHSTLLSLGTYLGPFCLPRRFLAPAAPAPACRPQ
jgi:hypothetical protein